MTALRVITPREASMFACLADTVVAPAGGLPPVAATDAARAFDEQLALSPKLNRAGLRAALYVLELAPLLSGAGARLRRLDPAGRAEALARLDRNAAAAPLLKAMRGVAHLCYYGDPGVMAHLGYDAERVVARGRALRAQEGRW